MRDIFVYSDTILKNYLDDIDFYSYMNSDEIQDYRLKVKLKGYNFKGKHVHTNYLYWLAKNRGHNINIVDQLDTLPARSVVFFHHDNYISLKYREDLIYVQILSDKPLIPFADYYVTNSKAFYNLKKFNNILFLPEPLPAKNLLFTPSKTIKSPVNFRFLGIRNNFPAFLSHDVCDELQKDGIIIKKDFSKNFLEPEDDVFFFIRNCLNPMSTCKHSNRIFLSYITEIPFIGSISEEDKEYIDDIDAFLPLTNHGNCSNYPFRKEDLIKAFYLIKDESVFSSKKNKLANVNKTFYTNYFFDELDKLINYFQKL